MPKEIQRERKDIYADICEFLYNFGPKRVTRIIQACNLRPDLSKEYFTDLINRQWVTKNQDDEYQITGKGISYLRDYINLMVNFFPEWLEKFKGGRFWQPTRRIP